MPDEWLGEENHARFVDSYHRLTAPIVLWGCVGSLAGGEAPRSTLAEVDVHSGATHWRLLWVTDSKVIYVDATKEISDWDAHDPHPEAGVPDQLDAWSRARSSVVQVCVAGASARQQQTHRGRSWEWEATHKVTFHDRTEIGLPLFGRCRTDDHGRAVEDVVRALF